MKGPALSSSGRRVAHGLLRRPRRACWPAIALDPSLAGDGSSAASDASDAASTGDAAPPANAADGSDAAAGDADSPDTCPVVVPADVTQCCGHVRCVGKGCNDARCNDCQLCAASTVCCIKKPNAAALCGANVAACK